MLKSASLPLRSKGKEITTPASSAQSWTIASVSILVLVAFLVHLYHIDFQSFWWDETLSALRARGDLAYILSNKITLFNDVTIDQHPPLYFLLLHFAGAAFGMSEFSLRYLSAAFMLLAIPLSYQTGRLLEGKTAGLLAGLAVAVSPFYLWYSQEARPYAQVALLSTLSFYLFIRLIKHSSIHFLLYYVLVVAALLATHYLTLVLVFAQTVCLLSVAILEGRFRARAAIVALCAICLGLALGGPYAVSRYLILSNGPLSMSIGSIIRDLTVTFTFGVTVNQFTFEPIAFSLAGIALAGAISGIWRGGNRRIVATWISALLSLGLVYVISQYKSVYGARYVIFLAPAFYLLIGYGSAQLRRFHASLPAVFAICFFIAGTVGSYNYLIVDNTGKQDFRAVAKYITDHAQKGDGVILDDKRIVSAFEYYPVGDYPLYGIPAFPTSDPEVVSRQLSAVATQHPRLWLVTAWSQDIDPKGLVNSILKERFQQIDQHTVVGSDYSIGVSLFSTRPVKLSAIPKDALKTEINFGNKLDLVGYHVTRPAKPGNRFDVDFYWRVETGNMPRLAMFGQLVDGQGNAWGAFDGEPYQGFASTDRWAKDSIVDDRRELWVPPGTPPGTYALRVGVRPVNSSSRPLPILDAEGTTANDVAEIARAVELNQPVEGDEKSLDLANRIDATFGDGLTLLGGDDLVRNLSAGQEISLRLFWRDGSVNNEDIDVEFWLTDVHGHAVRIAESPLSTLAPSAWPKGKVIGAYYQLRLPVDIDPGSYQIAIRTVDHSTRAALDARFGLNPFPQQTVPLGQTNISVPVRHFALPASLHQIGAILGGSIELAGLEPTASKEAIFSSEPGPMAKIEFNSPPRDPVEIKLWWKALAPVQKDYVAFVQVLNSKGLLVDQHDGVPSNGSRPTTGWAPGETIEDIHLLSKVGQLPPGVYSIIAGMYDSRTGERLKLSNETDDYVKVADLVLP